LRAGSILVSKQQILYTSLMPYSNLTYDAIAEDYQRLAVPLVFLSPAKDLLSALKLSPDANILDVGAGGRGNCTGDSRD